MFPAEIKSLFLEIIVGTNGRHCSFGRHFYFALNRPHYGVTSHA